MAYSTRSRPTLPASLPLLLVATSLALAQPPGEVQNIRFDDPATLVWDAAPGADFYNVYRGTVSGLRSGDAGRCHGFEIANTDFTTPTDPTSDRVYFYLVTAESSVDGEGTPGSQSGMLPRALRGSCTAVMRNHVLNRLGYGWNEWTRDRVDALGLQGYIDEQLSPSLIIEDDEYRNLAAPYEPPVDIFGLIARQVLGPVYSRRQLEWQTSIFWVNHFNTFWGKLSDIFVNVFPQCDSPGVPEQCDPNFPARAYEVASELQWREMNQYRDLTFGAGNFRQLIEANAMSPAMILYLDTYTSIVGRPNENYPRELMELYSMGVDGGYTQTDVEELSRVFTGWTICKKTLANAADPLAGCIEAYWLATPVGSWVAHFRVNQHDCTAKTLFAGTPQQITIPDTCGNPRDGVNDVALALDAIAAHPSTARFIAKKILQRFVTDEPAEAMIDDLVAVWNDAGNPNGVGDLHAVLSAALNHPAFLDPDRGSGKIKTPLEHFTSAIRAVGGHTDGINYILTFLVFAQHIPHFNEVPTGYSEIGEDWIGTNNVLERQNFGLALALLNEIEFGSDPVALLNANGVSTAPGNAEAIVDFFADTLFGGSLTPTERQAAIDYLNTDSSGLPATYDDGRIRETVGFLLGYPQFQEQ